MLNSKMKRGMAWIMSAAVIMSAAPVSAEDFTAEADVEVTAEAADAGAEENTDAPEVEAEEDGGFGSGEMISEENTAEAGSDETGLTDEENAGDESADFMDGFSDGSAEEESADVSDGFIDEGMSTEELVQLFAGENSANDAPYSSVEKLENGTYTVTANVYVPGELNKVLVNTNAFLTNPKYPFASGANYGRPDRPMYYNAQLVVNDDDITVTLELKNPVFQALQINDGANVTIADKTYNEELSTSEIHTKYGNKIQTVTFKLKDYSGFYPLSDCKEFASILYTEGNSATEADAVWDVPLNLAVDFQGIGKEEKTVTTNFLNEDLGVALVTQRELPEGTQQDMHEVTAESTGAEGELYNEVKTYLTSKSQSLNDLNFRILYVGLKDVNGNPIKNIQQYAPTFYTNSNDFFEGVSGRRWQAFGRWNDGKFTTHLQRISSYDIVNDLAQFSPEGTDIWNDMYSWENGEFSGGYVVLYDTSAYVQFEYHLEDSDMGITYYSVSGGTDGISHETTANTYYRMKASKNKRGLNDKVLEEKIESDSKYKKGHLNTYQIAMYASNTNPTTDNIIRHVNKKQTALKIELPVK